MRAIGSPAIRCASNEIPKESADPSEGWDLRFCVGNKFGCLPSSNLLLEGADAQRPDVQAANADACRPALTIIGLLQNTLGLTFDSSNPLSRMPGFLFDMNAFFQRLVSRFLHDNLTVDRIADESAIRGLFSYAPDANPRRRKAPAPRPDYALFRGKILKGFLDAKYRDIWEANLPAEWLYQLSVYALASLSELSVLLYASTAEEACDERIEVHQPVPLIGGIASVVYRFLARLGRFGSPKVGMAPGISRATGSDESGLPWAFFITDLSRNPQADSG